MLPVCSIGGCGLCQERSVNIAGSDEFSGLGATLRFAGGAGTRYHSSCVRNGCIPTAQADGDKGPVKPHSRTMPAIVILLALAACSSQPPPAPPTPKAAFVSFDGTYRGRIRVSSHTLGGPNSNWCDTPQTISLSIQHNAFRYLLAHPNLPPDPDLSPTIEVTEISPDGSFDGFPINGGPEMVGSITGSHMEGEIHGLGCAYTFAAERS
jgi:hypothetical protein